MKLIDTLVAALCVGHPGGLLSDAGGCAAGLDVTDLRSGPPSSRPMGRRRDEGQLCYACQTRVYECSLTPPSFLVRDVLAARQTISM